MTLLGFHSFAEFNTCVTFVLIGCSIMLVVSSVTSAPSFVTAFYMYATGDPNAVCEKPYFWNNANTFYNVATYVTQLSCESLSLVPVFRKIPLRYRMLVSLFLPFAELILLVIIPVVKVPTQNGAIAVLMVVAVMGGFSKALCDSTTNALTSTFPSKFMNFELWGLTVISLVMSLIQIALKATMGTSFDDVLTQSRIYFGIAIGLQFVTIAEFVVLVRNPFAKKYVAEFRQLGRGRHVTEAEESFEAGSVEPTNEGTVSALEPATDDQVQVLELRSASREASAGSVENKCDPCNDEDEDRVRRVSLDSAGNVRPYSQALARIGANGEEVTGGSDDDDTQYGTNAAVLRAKGDADKMVDRDQVGNLTSSDQMLRASLWPVVKKVYPMLFTTFFVYFTSMTLFPGVFFAVDRDGEWFSTIIVLLFNAGDFTSRILLMFRPLQPSAMFCLIGCFCRLSVVPLLALCVHGTIHGTWLPYVLITLFGLSNGFIGSRSMVLCARTPTLHTAGERALAGVTAGVLLQCGLAFGSNLALAINLLL